VKFDEFCFVPLLIIAFSNEAVAFGSASKPFPFNDTSRSDGLSEPSPFFIDCVSITLSLIWLYKMLASVLNVTLLGII